MAFTKEKALSPTSIGDIAIEIFSPSPTNQQPQTITARVQVVMDDGSVRQRSVDLADVLSAQVLNQLTTMAANLRTRAQTEVIG